MSNRVCACRLPLHEILSTSVLIARCRCPNCWDNHGIGFGSSCYEWCCEDLEWLRRTLWGSLLELFNTFVITIVFFFSKLILHQWLYLYVCVYDVFFIISNELWIQMHIIKFIFSRLKYYHLIKIARRHCLMHCRLRSEALRSLLLVTVLKPIYQARYEFFSIYTDLI